MRNGLSRLLRLIRHSPDDAVLMMDPGNFRYVTGLEIATSCLIIFDHEIHIFTDISYYPALKAQNLGFCIHCAERSPWVDALRWLKQQHVTIIRIDPMVIPYAFIEVAKELLGNIEWIDIGEELAAIRSIKTREEIARIGEAVCATEAVLNEVKKSLKMVLLSYQPLPL